MHQHFLITIAPSTLSKTVTNHHKAIKKNGAVLTHVCAIRATDRVRVSVIPDDKVDCYLGANFVRTFGTIHDPINNQLIVSAADKRVDLEVARVSSVEALEVSAIGLDDVSEEQRQEMA